MFICEKEFDCVDCPRIDPRESCEHWIEVEQVSRGKWISKGHWCFACSCCGRMTHDYEGSVVAWSYCPYCGAKMDEVSEWLK